MTEQDSLIKFCEHCGDRNVTSQGTDCKECGGPLVKQQPLFDL